jgi:uncharacterized protein (TIGR03435 family)
VRYPLLGAIALICTSLGAQTPLARPQFEVASVRPVVTDERSASLSQRLREFTGSQQRPGWIPMENAGRVRLQNWALLDLIAAACSVRATQVSGPEWLSGQGFDIEAKMPDGSSKEELNAMLQSLLEERFGLKVHRGTQSGQGFALIVGKDGPKLKPADPPSAPPAQTLSEEELKAKQAQNRENMNASMAAQRKRMQENGLAQRGFSSRSWSAITPEGLASQLVQFVHAPVVDATGLTGKYRVTIEISENTDVPGDTVFDAVEKLGLKLEPRKVTVETVVVDQVSKTPTEN